jgi:hypothetical protein
MAGQDLWSLFAAALGGGLFVKLFEIAHEEYKSRKAQRLDHSHSVDRSLEPLLRATDELVGKLRSLAEQDFIPIHDADMGSLDETGFASVIYLFVQFWSEVEIVRVHGLSTAIAKSPRGKQTQAFLTCLQSRRIRLIDRISQRALGEAALVDGKAMNFVEFVRAFDSDPYIKRWLEPLFNALRNIKSTHERQKVLQYAVVLHALIDTLDKEHLVTRDRPATPNKLNKHSRRELNYRVFGVYLTFVTNRTKYIGPLN